MPPPVPYTGLAGQPAAPGTIQPDNYQRISASPDAFGADVGQAEQGLGQGFQKAASAADTLIAFHDKTVADDTTNQFMTASRNLLYGDPNAAPGDPAAKGFLQLQGKDALNAWPTVASQLEQQRVAIGAGLTAPQKLEFDEQSRRYAQNTLQQVGSHADQQGVVYQAQTAQSTIANFAQDASLATTSGDDARWMQSVGSAQHASEQFDISRGADPATIQANKASILSNAWDQRIKLTATSNPLAANDMLTKAMGSGALEPNAGAALSAYLAPKVKSYRLNGIADEAIGAASPGAPLPAGPLVNKITASAATHGVSSGLALTVANVETGIGTVPDRPGSQFQGPFQMGDGAWAAMGGTAANRNDPDAQVNLGVANVAHSQDVAQQALGAKPADWQTYVVHQQGDQGGGALLKADPNAPAATVLAAAYGGNRATATMALVANGGRPDSTVGQFLQHWQQVYAAKQVASPAGDQPPIQAAGSPARPLHIASTHADELFPPPGTAPVQVAANMPLQPTATDASGSAAAPVSAAPAAPAAPQLSQADYYRNNEVAILDSVRAKAAALYPDDPNAADVAVSRAQQRMGAVIQQQQASYKADSDLVFQAANGDLRKGTHPATIDDLIATSPQVASAWDRMQTQQPQVAHEVATRLLTENARGQTGDTKTLGPSFYDVFNAIHAPDGSPARITDPNQLNGLVGHGLTMEGLAKARAELAGKSTPDGEAESAMRATFFRAAKGEISGADDGLGIKDPKGDQQFLRFQAQAYPAIEAAKAAGKSPAQIYNPDSPDYVGKIIPGFKRSLAQQTADMMSATGVSSSAPAAPAPAPWFTFGFGSTPEAPVDLGSPAGIKDALGRGKITRAEAVSRLTGTYAAPAGRGALPVAQQDTP